MVVRVAVVTLLRCVFGMMINKKNVLAFLILLEVSAVGVFSLGLSFYAEMSLYPFGVILIIVGACDGAIGLGLLIRYVRGAGNDFTSPSLFLKL